MIAMSQKQTNNNQKNFTFSKWVHKNLLPSSAYSLLYQTVYNMSEITAVTQQHRYAALLCFANTHEKHNKFSHKKEERNFISIPYSSICCFGTNPHWFKNIYFVALYLVSGYFFPIVAWGSCWRIARIAVGAVNIEETPCSDKTRKKAPESGVPTGFPWNHTVQQQLVTLQLN